MAWNTLDDMNLTGKVVLTRVDINVPVADGIVTDMTRMERIAPTIADILAKGGKPVLLAHFGRPKGTIVPEMSMKQLVPTLTGVLGVPVHFAEDCIGLPAKLALSSLPDGEVLLLENTRFHPEEEKNDARFAASLAALGDIYCNDAFSAAHRAHASTEAIARLLPSCAGRLMQQELSALDAALGSPQRPVLAVVGGAKVSTKLQLLENLVDKVDVLVIGGGMANTFLAAQGFAIGNSLAELEMTGTAQTILDKARGSNCAILLPTDVVVAREFAAGTESWVTPADACPDDAMILDVGPETVELVNQALDKVETAIWNGPLGAFEIPPFNTATDATALHAAELTREGKLISVAGGGDTVAALNASGASQNFSYISTAGGAFLEWMEGRVLPGVAALEASANSKTRR